MARIVAEPGTLQVTARLLHQIAQPNQIQFFPHEREGAVFVVSEAIAESFVLAVAAMDEPDEPKSKKKAKG